MVQEPCDADLPVREPFRSAAVKIKEAHQQAKPKIHLDPRHRLADEFERLYDTLDHARLPARQKRRA